MKKQLCVLTITGVMLGLWGCSENQAPAPAAETAAPPPPAAQHESASPAAITGRVLETMDAAGYTYVRIESGPGSVWAAGPKTAVTPGDTVTIPTGMLKRDFTSKTLNRTFEEIYFVGSITTGDAPAAAPDGDGASRTVASAPAGIDFSGITPPEGGRTVADIYAARQDLSGTTIRLRGRVVKFSPDIMGKNWVHVQDGTGGEDTRDLTVVTQDRVAVGDTVLVEGTVALNRDLGFGYHYDVLIEKAAVKKD